MRGDFEKQIESCARNSLCAPPLPIAKSNSGPLILRRIYEKSAPDRMRVHETQAAFLKALIAYEDGEASRQLQDGLAKAERESKCIRRAMFLVGILFMLSLSGLGYCSVLRPEFLHAPRSHVLSTLGGLGLGSLISLVVFFGCLLWNRASAGQLQKECRRKVLLLVESQFDRSS